MPLPSPPLWGEGARRAGEGGTSWPSYYLLKLSKTMKGVYGDVSATGETAHPDRDIPLGLTALSPVQGGISRMSLMHHLSRPILQDSLSFK